MLGNRLLMTIVAGAAGLVFAGGIASAADNSCFPASGDDAGCLPGQATSQTYADRNVNAVSDEVASCFPADAGEGQCGQPAMKTYADRHATEVGATVESAGGMIGAASAKDD